MSEPAHDIELYEEPEHHVARVAVTPQVPAAELVARLDVIRDAMKHAMEKDVDYGVIPGTGNKPTLLKPGAEKLGALFQLDVQIDNEKIWHDNGHLTVISRATVFHQPTGTRLGSGEGICTSREQKYAFRDEQRACPQCGDAAIIKGKAEYGGGWLCFKKKGGCGAKFPDGDASIESQKVGKVPNDNLADTYNTVDKMASKRARIDAVLAVTGASAIFTQDVEDAATDKPAATSEPVPASAEAKVISEAQISRLMAIANKNDVTEERLKELVADVAGVQSRKLIPKDRYDALVHAVELESVPF